MAEIRAISDRGLAVLAFAIYHQLESGSRVTQVVREDGAGHHADPEAIQELQRLGLVHVDENRIGFTDRGEAILDLVIAEMRRATAQPQLTDSGAPESRDPQARGEPKAIRSGYS